MSEWISETVSDKNRLEVDVALSVGQDLRSEDGDVVAGIRFSSNVEVLLGILWELLEEESEKSVDILSGGNSVANRSTAV